MLKVFVTGFNEPYGITGELVSEDAEYLIISEGVKVRRIPRARIVFVEEYDEETPVVRSKPSNGPNITPLDPSKLPPPLDPTKFAPIGIPGRKDKPEPPLVPPGTTTPVGPPPRTKSYKEAVEEAAAKQRQARTAPLQPHVPFERASQVDPVEPPPSYDPDDKMLVEVIFNGTKKGEFDVYVPRGVMTGAYTPSLGREIFKEAEVKAMLADGTMLDGLPIIKENKIYYTTKEAVKKEQSGVEKMQMAGQLMNAGSQLMNLQGQASPTQMPKKTTSIKPVDFSMPASPFSAVPTLSINEDDES